MTSLRLLFQPESTLSNARQAPPKQPIQRSGTSRFRLVSLVLCCGGVAIMTVFAVLSLCVLSQIGRAL